MPTSQHLSTDTRLIQHPAVWLEATLVRKAGGEISLGRLVVVKKIDVEEWWEEMVPTLSNGSKTEDSRLAKLGYLFQMSIPLSSEHHTYESVEC